LTKTVARGVIRTKKTLKSALLSLMATENFQDITITQIVNEANYSRGTFYFHYTHKEALLDEMIDDMLQELVAAFRAPYKDLKEKININELSTIELCNHFINNKDFYKIMLCANPTHNFREMMMKTLEQLLRKEVSFSSTNTEFFIDNDLLIIYRINGIIGIIMEWINSNFSHTRDYLSEQIINISTFHTATFYTTVDSLEETRAET